MKKTIVVNRYYEKFDEYCGRGTPAGNPFIVGIDGDRDKCCIKFKKYFLWRIKWDKTFKKYILSLKGKRIACSCKPKRCHLNTIADYLNEKAD